MDNMNSRRDFFVKGTTAIGTATIGAGLLTMGHAQGKTGKNPIKIIGISGSPRRGKTTVESLQLALSAARAVAPDQIETEIVELLDYELFDTERVLGPAAMKGTGSFAKLQAKLADVSVRGIIVGSPVHNSMPSVLISAFFAQIDHTILQGKIAGALAVGGARNGGQESVVSGLNTYLFHEGLLMPGTGKAGRIGALLWNQKDSVAADEFGKKLVQALGERVAKVALALPHDLLAQNSK